jgi:hypothetical protein
LGTLCYYDSSYRNIIYYRGLEEYETWDATTNDYQHNNHLYLFTGPCFTGDNLGTEINKVKI